MSSINFYKNFLLVILSLVVSLVVVYPEIALYRDNGFVSGVNLMGTDAEAHYLARIHEIYDGHYLLGNTYLEPKNIPYLQPPGGELVEGVAGIVFHLPIYWLNIIFKFVAVIGMFWIVFALIWSLTKNLWGALLAPLFVILGEGFFSYPINFLRMLFGQSAPNIALNWFERPINPEISLPVIFGFLLVFYLFYQTGKKRYFILSAILLGFSFYLTIFAWGFMGLFAGVFFLIDWWRKKKINWSLVGVGVAGIFLSVPYWINFWQSIHNSNYVEAAQRQGLVLSRAPIISATSLILIALILFFIWVYKKYEAHHTQAMLGISAATAIILAENQQILTGQTVQPAHFHSYVAIPALLIVGGAAIGIVLKWWAKSEKKKIISWSAVTLVMLLLIFTSFRAQGYAYAEQKDAALNDQAYAPVIEWLNQNAQKDQVVEGDPEFLNEIIPIYTDLNVYYSNMSGPYFNDFDRLENGLFLGYRLQGMTPQMAQRDFFGALRAQISAALFGIYYRDAYGGYDKIPDNLIQKIINDYGAYYQKDWSEVLSRYSLDYIIMDMRQGTFGLYDPSLLTHLSERAVIDGRFVIFSVNK